MKTAVTISGYYGEVWLEHLEGSAVGPSSVRYSFDSCDLVSMEPDGSATVQATQRVNERIIQVHLDDSVCRSYPCDKVHTRAYSVKRRYVTGVVPAGNWTIGGRGLLPLEEIRPLSVEKEG